MSRTHGLRGNALLGVILIVLGALFLLSNFDLVDFGNLIATWWPMILIIIAVSNLTSSAERRSGGAYLLLAVGILLQAIMLDIFSWSVFSYAWPVILILLGLRILFGSRLARGTGAGATDDSSLAATAFMGGSNHIVTSQQFHGGQATAICGGIDIDLRQAQLAPGKVVLHVTAICGGVEIIAPAGWRVVMGGTPILGGLENKTAGSDDESRPTLWINAFAICAAVEVHN